MGVTGTSTAVPIGLAGVAILSTHTSSIPPGAEVVHAPSLTHGWVRYRTPGRVSETIRQAALRHVRQQAELVRRDEEILHRMRRTLGTSMRTLRTYMHDAKLHGVTDDELASATGFDVTQVRELLSDQPGS